MAAVVHGNTADGCLPPAHDSVYGAFSGTGAATAHSVGLGCLASVQLTCGVVILASAVVISFNTLGLVVNDDASREASIAAASANQLLESLTRAALNAFSSGLETISMPLLSFINSYVGRLRALVKRGEQLPASAQMHLQVGKAVCAVDSLVSASRYRHARLK